MLHVSLMICINAANFKKIGEGECRTCFFCPTFTWNDLSRKGCTPETKAKVAGVVKKLKSYPFLCKVATYLDIPDIMGPISLVFEKHDLMAFEIPSGVEKTCDTLVEMLENTLSSDYVLSSNLAKFRIVQDGGAIKVKANYPKASHERRQPENQEFFDLELEQMSDAGYGGTEKALEMQVKVAGIFCPLSLNRFSLHDQDIFKTVTWIDPKYWDSADKSYGKRDIARVCEIFSKPLEAASFNKGKVFEEWRSLKIPQKSLYPKMKSRQLWERFSPSENESSQICLSS